MSWVLQNTMYCNVHGKSPIVIDTSSGYPRPRCKYCVGR